jgi:hypothetical protein
MFAPNRQPQGTPSYRLFPCSDLAFPGRQFVSSEAFVLWCTRWGRAKITFSLKPFCSYLYRSGSINCYREVSKKNRVQEYLASVYKALYNYLLNNILTSIVL